MNSATYTDFFSLYSLLRLQLIYTRDKSRLVNCETTIFVQSVPSPHCKEVL